MCIKERPLGCWVAGHEAEWDGQGEQPGNCCSDLGKKKRSNMLKMTDCLQAVCYFGKSTQVGDVIMLARVDSAGELGIISGGLQPQISWLLQLCAPTH